MKSLIVAFVLALGCSFVVGDVQAAPQDPKEIIKSENSKATGKSDPKTSIASKNSKAIGKHGPIIVTKPCYTRTGQKCKK
jgi:hypothetical protein